MKCVARRTGLCTDRTLQVGRCTDVHCPRVVAVPRDDFILEHEHRCYSCNVVTVVMLLFCGSLHPVRRVCTRQQHVGITGHRRIRMWLSLITGPITNTTLTINVILTIIDVLVFCWPGSTIDASIGSWLIHSRSHKIKDAPVANFVVQLLRPS